MNKPIKCFFGIHEWKWKSNMYFPSDCPDGTSLLSTFVCTRCGKEYNEFYSGGH